MKSFLYTWGLKSRVLQLPKNDTHKFGVYMRKLYSVPNVLANTVRYSTISVPVYNSDHVRDRSKITGGFSANFGPFGLTMFVRA